MDTHEASPSPFVPSQASFITWSTLSRTRQVGCTCRVKNNYRAAKAYRKTDTMSLPFRSPSCCRRLALGGIPKNSIPSRFTKAKARLFTCRGWLWPPKSMTKCVQLIGEGVPDISIYLCDDTHPWSRNLFALLVFLPVL